jgi:hypothetical protein
VILTSSQKIGRSKETPIFLDFEDAYTIHDSELPNMAEPMASVIPEHLMGTLIRIKLLELLRSET